MGYLKTTINSISWSVAQRWVIRGLAFVRIAILARLLLPVQIGVFGIATLVLGFLEIFTETWVNVFLVQEEGSIDHYVNTSWVVSIIRGLLIGFLIALTASWVSAFFNSPNSFPLIFLVSIVPAIRGFINPSVAKMQKDLHFKTEFGYKSFLFIIEAIISITLALITRQAISLVWGMIISAIFEVILSFKYFSPRPVFSVNTTQIAQIFHRGKWITAAGIFNYLYQNGDNLVVGKLLGEYSLGIYSSAYKISSLPISEISDVIARVTFPIFVKISSDTQRLKNAFIKSSLLVSLVSVSLGIGLYFFARPVVLIVLGPAWVDAIPALRVLSFYGVAKSITNTMFPVFFATKRQDFVTWVTLTSVAGLGLTIVPFVSKWGIVGAGFSATCGALTALPLALYFAHKLLWSKSE
jgi:O-antigen/teichoic acid export membrane protein